MIEFLAIGSAVAFGINRYVLGKKPEPVAPPQPTQQVVGGVVLDAPIEPKTAEGVMFLLREGTIPQLETAALSLLRSNLPIASRQCADRAASLRARERFAQAKADRDARDAQAKADAQKKIEVIENAAKEKANAPAAAE